MIVDRLDAGLEDVQDTYHREDVGIDLDFAGAEVVVGSPYLQR